MSQKRRPECEHPDRPHWARGMCGTCYQRWWQEQNPGKTRARRAATERPATCHPDKPELAKGLCGTCYRRQWRLANPGAEWERQNVAQKRKYQQSEGHRRRMILRRYGVTPEWYDEKLASQNGVCVVCQEAPAAGKNLQVDHCHESGRVRDLLCANCNSTLGHSRESVERLHGLVAYLARHRSVD